MTDECPWPMFFNSFLDSKREANDQKDKGVREREAVFER